MDIGSSFTYMFQDEGWLKKILIGGLVTLVPIVNFAALGYIVEIIRNMRNGQTLPLPEWDKFGEYFMSGLYLFVIYLIYSIPLIVVACIQGVAMAALGGGAGMATEFSGGVDATGAAASAAVIIQICTSCLMLIWAVVIWAVAPAVMIRFADDGQISTAFKFSEIIDMIKADVGSYVIVMLLMMVASGIIAPFGMILCVIGVIFTQFWAYLVWGNLLGQLGNKIRPGGSVAVS